MASVAGITSRMIGAATGALNRLPGTQLRQLVTSQFTSMPGMGDALWGPVGQPANLAAVMHATRLIVEPLSSMPWQVRTPDGIQPAPRWVSDPMLARQDARFPGGSAPATHTMSGVEFWSQWITDALWNGRGFLLFLEGSDGQPTAGTLRVIASGLVTTTQDPQMGPRWLVSTQGATPQLLFDRDGRWVENRRVRMVMLRGEPPYDPLTGHGLGVLQRAAGELEVLGRIQRYTSGTFRSGIPAGYLKSTQPLLTKDQADGLKASWMAAHGSVDERTIAVLNATTDFTAISLSPEDMALVESKRMALLDVALAFGVPPYQLGAATNTMTYSNTETELQALVTMTLNTRASRVEGCLSPLLPAGQDLDIDFRGMLRGDTATRTAYYGAGIRDGWMSPQIAAELEGFDPRRVAADLAAIKPAAPEPPAIDAAEEAPNDSAAA